MVYLFYFVIDCLAHTDSSVYILSRIHRIKDSWDLHDGFKEEAKISWISWSNVIAPVRKGVRIGSLSDADHAMLVSGGKI